MQITGQTLKVLGAIGARAGDDLSGAEIGQQTGLPSGTLYPILFRLEGAGWLKSRWEEEDPRALGRPRRRYYGLTALGKASVSSAFRDVRSVVGELAWE